MKTREPLRSRAFRLLLVALTATAIVAVFLSWRTGRRANDAAETALARANASHEIELQFERLHASARAADAATETFLETWRTRRLEAAAEAEAAVRRQFDALQPTFASDADVAQLAQEIDQVIDERQAHFTQLVEWARAGQLNRVREWAEAHRDAIRAARLERLLARLQESEHANRERDRLALARALSRSAGAARFSWALQAGLALLVLWLLWQYERTRRLVVMCAWTRTIQYEGEWLTFEEYLKRRFGLETTHGIRPDQADKILEDDRSPDAEERRK